MVLIDSQVIYLSGQKVCMMCLFWLEGHIVLDLSNPYGIAGTLLHVKVSQSYLLKPVSILLSFQLFQAAFLEPIPYVKNSRRSYSVYWSAPAVL